MRRPLDRRCAPALALALLAALPARADEGMWTFNHFPSDRVAAAYGFGPTPAWLEEVQLSSARLAQGCSASFVSPRGLVMTNHHCAHRCIEQLSTGRDDRVRDGFLARSDAEEARCPELEVNQLLSIADVTARMNAATEGKAGAAFFAAQRATRAAIEAACQTSPELRCEVVSLYRGGRYDLYRYRRYQDVRLVFAPEFAIAFFGGDPDNFNFPRYDLDVAFLRVYRDGKPAPTEHWFRWSPGGPREGELTFVSGNPGGTSRQLTVAQLEYQRDVVLFERLLALTELRGALVEYAHRGAEQARHSEATLFYVENSVKALLGRIRALQDRDFFASRVAAEAAFRARLAADPARAARFLHAFDDVARATAELRRLHLRLEEEERPGPLAGDLGGFARALVRAGAERPKPNGERLREYADAALPALEQRLLSPAPIHPEFEIFLLTRSLTTLRERLGADDPFVREVLGTASPAALARTLVEGTRLADPAVRRALYQGGAAAVAEAARTDPLLALALRIDPAARAVRRQLDETIEPLLTRGQERIARAHFELEGTSAYPDATFTPRLSYGAVKGYEEDGRRVAPFTTFAGAFARATGSDPYALPRSWLDARPRLALDTPLDLCTTNDIIGGNSGSPVVNARREIVGLIFDGNIQSLGGDFGFDAAVNRAVAVDSAAIVEALEKIYGAGRLVDELRPPAAPAAR